MEVIENGRRLCRENNNSPVRERGKKLQSSTRRSVIRPSFRKVQVVYYLSRNGQLEHPHYMEVTFLAHQQLRLKDVIDRLIVLRGRGMPSLYSWSCKRSYKNGYVWNDLAENDFICPSEGAEYVLKGSEIIEGSTEKFQQLHIAEIPRLRNNQQVQDSSNFLPKHRPVCTKQHPEPEEEYEQEDDEVHEDEEEEYEEKSSYTSSTTPQYSRCSRGVVCTDELIQQEQEPMITRKNTTNSLLSPPPSATSSSNILDKPINHDITNTSKLFEDGDPVCNTGSPLSRNSMLLQLISCGGSVSFRKTTEPPKIVRQLPPPPSPPSTVVARKSSCSNSSGSFHKGVLCKAAAKVEMNEVEEIKYMSENPRFGNLQLEEKEYFSGSIVESMATEERTAQVDPQLKKSSSYNEERSSKAGLRAVAAEEELKKQKAAKGKCIPRKKSSSKQSKK